MNVLSQPLVGTYLISPKVVADHRGCFVKTFHADAFAEIGFRFQPAEEFYSVSRKNVIRGMHFQLPPHDHEKIVYCVTGRALDVLLDLRRESATYGKTAAAVLSADNNQQFLIPKGVAHGFAAMEERTTIVYQVSSVHAPSHDAGVLWSSIGFDWGIKQPILSERDRSLPLLAAFPSPF